MVSIISFITIFVVIITVHEYGHFIAAKTLGVGVEEFSIGFGPKLISQKSSKSGTRYSLRLILLGGYCALLDESGEGKENDEVKGERFSTAKVWKRMIIIIMGPVMNIVLAFACYTLTVNMTGVKLTEISSITEGSPAEEAGLEVGGVITSINSSRVYTVSEAQVCILYGNGNPITVTYTLDGEKRTAVINPYYNEQKQGYMIGITFDGDLTKPTNIFETLKYSYYELHNMLHQTFVGFKVLVSGNVSREDVTGPVGMYNIVREPMEIANDVSKVALIELVLAVMAMLSINIGIVNMIPIPALDGGRFMMLLIEAIARRKIPRKIETAIVSATFVMLIILSAYIMFGDIQTMVKDIGIM